jgi:hypothetical protein
MTNLIPRAPKRKKQPTAECYREQLALAADEIIRLREFIESAGWSFPSAHFYAIPVPKRPSWWQKLMDEIAETPWEELPGWARLLRAFHRRKPA